MLKTMGSDLFQQLEKYGFQGSNGSSIADSFARLVAASKASGDRPRPLQAARPVEWAAIHRRSWALAA